MTQEQERVEAGRNEELRATPSRPVPPSISRAQIDRALLQLREGEVLQPRERSFFSGKPRWPELADVSAPHVFRRLVERERVRCDRTGRAFCVLAIPVQRDASVDELRAVIGAVFGRLRGTDSVGWLASDRMGVLLRGADVDAAVRVAEELGDALGRRGASPRCQVYPHPPLVARVAQPRRKQTARDSPLPEASEYNRTESTAPDY